MCTHLSTGMRTWWPLGSAARRDAESLIYEGVLEKTPKDDLGIFITYFEDYQTRVKPVREKELVEIINGSVIDLFFNIERYLELHE
jgi:hypothetical protein